LKSKPVKNSKLALVIPSLQAGGMERVMSELAGFFSEKSGLEVHLVIYGMSREIFYEIPSSVQVHKPTFKFNEGKRIISALKTILFLRKTIKKLHPDSVLSFGEYWNSFVLIALFALKYPVFISDRCQPDKKLGTYHDYLRRILYRRSRGIVAQTEKAKEIYFKDLGHSNISVIGNPIRQISTEKEVERENSVLMVGRLIQSKHHDQLIEIFLSIAEPGWKLVIVGYDHLKQHVSDKLEKLIRGHHAEGIIKLEGKQSDVDRYYLGSKIFAFTSSSEGFPNVIGEAMSAGLPVIAYDCIAGPSEMIDDGRNGFLVPLFDMETFKIRVKELMNDEAKRKQFGNQARRSIQKYSINEIGEKYFEFILDNK